MASSSSPSRPSTCVTATDTIPLPLSLLALTLVTSVPRGLSLQVYIDGLRKNMTTMLQHNGELQSRGLSKTTTSRQETDLECNGTQILATVGLKSLRSYHLRSHVNDNIQLERLRKRKQKDAELLRTRSDRVSKQARTARIPSRVQAISSPSETVANQVDSLYAREEGDGCLRLLCILRKLLSQKPSKVPLLCEVLRRLSCQVSQLLVSAGAIYRAAPSPGRRDEVRLREHAATMPAIKESLAQISTIFPFLVQGLDWLVNIPDSEASVDSVIFQIVGLFETLINTVCEIVAARTGTDAPNQETNPCASDLIVCTSKASSEQNISSQDHEVAAEFCTTTIALMRRLNPSNKVHEKILDGFFCRLLKRVGHCLNKLNYIIDEDETVIHVNGERISRGRENLETIKAQAPHLIMILERAIGFISTSRKETAVTSRSPHGSVTIDATQEDGGSSLSNTRLQHTLLKAVFGGDEFCLSLEPPTDSPDFYATIDLNKEMDLSETGKWFTKEVSRLIGWSVLGDMMDLSS